MFKRARRVRWALAVLLPSAALCQPSAVRNLNTTVASLVRRAPQDRQIQETLAARKAAIENTIREDPASVAGLKLDDSVIQALPASAAALLETPGEWTGSLEVLIQDDFTHGRSQTLRRLRTRNESFEIFLPEGNSARRDRTGAIVRVKGIRSGNLIAAESLTPAAQSIPSCSTTGDQKIAVLMVTTPSNPAFPAGWDATSISQKFFAPAGISLNGYWQDVSYGKTSASGQVAGPFALSKDYPCNTTGDLARAAIAAAGGALDLSQYNRLAIIFPIQTCTFGGLSTVGCTSAYSGLATAPVFSVSWLPVFPFQVPDLYVGILAHESGHALGLSHASTEDFGSATLGFPGAAGVTDEYGDPFSVMGNANQSGSSWLGLPIMGQYSAEHKSLLGWLQDSDYQQVRSNGTFELAPLESASGTRGLRVLRDAASNSWLWLEYRQPLGLVDSTLGLISHFKTTDIFQGALIHYESKELDPLRSYLLDFSSVATPNNFYNSTLRAGKSWSDSYSPLKLTVNLAENESLPVSVQYDAPCATVQSPPALFQPLADTGSITISAPPDCAWKAVATVSWLKLTEPTSGQGNGAVNFSVTANGSYTLRSTQIFLEHQAAAAAISQAGLGLSVFSPSPISGTSGIGTPVPFTFRVNDTYGVDDIRSVNIFFTGATGGCVFAVQPPSGNLLLKNDAGSAWLDPITSGTVSNSKCFFNAAGTSWTAASATELDITVQLGFTAASAGDYQIWVQPFGAPSVSAVAVAVGDWTVNPLPSISANGVVPIYSSSQTIQPGSWISIFGNSLAAGTAIWNNDFPPRLGGASVTIDGKPAYLWYVSPTQINLQAPDDDAAGPVEVVVTTPAGTATSTVTLGRYAPSFSLLDGKHVAGIILRPDGSGAYGNGAYDILGPTGDSLGYKTVAAKAGDILELFGVGFGPTNPVAPAGKAYSGAAPAVEPVTLSINNTVVTPDFCGITSAGLFQINIVRLPPGLGSGDAPVKATVGGQQTAAGPVISLE